MRSFRTELISLPTDASRHGCASGAVSLCARSSHRQKSGSKPPTESKRAAKTAESLELEEEVARWELDSREIQLGAKIGKGAFGVVYKGTLRGKEVRAPPRLIIGA